MKNQKGMMGLVEILIVMAIITIGGFIWWRMAGSPALVTDVPDDELVELTEASDVAKLPSVTPKTFIKYMEGLLELNESEETGCITTYIVDMISTVNVSGQVGSEYTSAKPGNSCIFAAATTWYLKDGAWTMISYSGPIGCNELASTTIYSEFMGGCVDDEDPAETILSNPNGSIKDTEL